MTKQIPTRRSALTTAAVAGLLAAGVTPTLAADSLEARVKAFGARHAGGPAGEQHAVKMLNQLLDACDKDESAMMMVHLTVLASQGDARAKVAIAAARTAYNAA